MHKCCITLNLIECLTRFFPPILHLKDTLIIQQALRYDGYTAMKRLKISDLDYGASVADK